MKLPLRSKLLLVLAPLLALSVALLAVLIAQHREVRSVAEQLEGNLNEPLQAAWLSVLVTRQLNMYWASLYRDPEPLRAQVTAARTEVEGLLSSLHGDLQGQAGSWPCQQAPGHLAAIRPLYVEADAQGQALLKAVSAGGDRSAITPMIQRLEASDQVLFERMEHFREAQAQCLRDKVVELSARMRQPWLFGEHLQGLLLDLYFDSSEALLAATVTAQMFRLFEELTESIPGSVPQPTSALLLLKAEIGETIEYWEDIIANEARNGTPEDGEARQFAEVDAAVKHFIATGDRLLAGAASEPEPNLVQTLDREMQPLLDSALLPVTQRVMQAQETSFQHTLETIRADTTAAALELLLVGGAMILFAGGGLWLISARVVRPILQISSAARQMAAGRLDMRAPVTSTDEIGELARVFNGAAHALDRALRSLRTRNIQHRVLGALLRIGMKQDALGGYLEHALATVASIPWLRGVPAAAILLLDAERGGLRLQAHHGLADDLRAGWEAIALGDARLRFLLQGGQPGFLGTDAVGTLDLDRGPGQRYRPYGVVIQSANTVLGLLVLYLHQDYAPTSANQRYLATVAGTLANSVERTLAQTALRRHNRSLQLLGQCHALVSRAEDETGLLQQACRIIADRGGYPLVWMGRSGSGAQAPVQALAWAGSAEGYLEALRNTGSGAGSLASPARTALAGGAPAVVQDLNDAPAGAWREAATRQGFIACAALPLAFGETSAAVLEVCSQRPGVFSTDELDLLGDLAAVIGYGVSALRARIENTRSLAEVQRQSQQRQVLNAILEIGLQRTSLTEQMEQVLDELVVLPWLSAMRKLGIFLREADADALTLAAHRNLPGPIIETCGRVELDRCLCGSAARSGNFGYVSTIDERHEVLYPGMSPHGHYVAPIISRDQVLGVLVVYLAEGHPHSADEEQFLTAVTNTLAGIIERRRMEQAVQTQELRLASARRLISMGELASVLAHQLNQPLAAANGFAHGCLNRLNQADGNPAELRFGLQQLLRQTERAGAIIQNLRSFLRRGEPQPRPVLLHALIQELMPAIGPMLETHQARLDLQVPDALPAVRCDSIQIQEVLINLIQNGLEAMDGNDVPQRQLRLVATSADGTVEVSITDLGHGLPDTHRQQLFQPFYTTKPDGMGLGLSICSSIIEANRGRLWASMRAQGTTFHFTLPEAEEDASDDAGARQRHGIRGR